MKIEYYLLTMTLIITAGIVCYGQLESFFSPITKRMNPPHHSCRQAANCARCGTFVKGVDSIKKNKTTIDTCLALDKGFATGLPLACR